MGAAGYDLYSAEPIVIRPNTCSVVHTDLQLHIPPSLCGRISPRSGLAIRSLIDVWGGVIDSDYRGNVGVILFNHGPEPFTVHRGDRIAQIIFEKIEIPFLIECPYELPQLARGNKGFGSTGTK